VIYNNSDDGDMIAMSNSIYVIIAGVFIIIGAIAQIGARNELKYQIGGSLLCLIIGLIYLIMGFQILKNLDSFAYIGTIFIVIGSMISLIAGHIKKKNF